MKRLKVSERIRVIYLNFSILPTSIRTIFLEFRLVKKDVCFVLPRKYHVILVKNIPICLRLRFSSNINFQRNERHKYMKYWQKIEILSSRTMFMERKGCSLGLLAGRTTKGTDSHRVKGTRRVDILTTEAMFELSSK